MTPLEHCEDNAKNARDTIERFWNRMCIISGSGSNFTELLKTNLRAYDREQIMNTTEFLKEYDSGRRNFRGVSFSELVLSDKSFVGLDLLGGQFLNFSLIDCVLKDCVIAPISWDVVRVTGCILQKGAYIDLTQGGPEKGVDVLLGSYWDAFSRCGGCKEAIEHTEETFFLFTSSGETHEFSCKCTKGPTTSSRADAYSQYAASTDFFYTKGTNETS